MWRKHVLHTDEVDTHRGEMLYRLCVNNVCTLSSQARRKLKGPCCRIQDRVVRTCAMEPMSEMHKVREVQRQEMDSYNQRQEHSTMKEAPSASAAP